MLDWILTPTIEDALTLKHTTVHDKKGSSGSSNDNTTAVGACYPMPITILFSPKKNVDYCSRFRFTCEFANSFDLVVQVEGTFEEHEHRPLHPIPR